MSATLSTHLAGESIALRDVTRDETSLRRFLHGLPGVDQVGAEARAAGLDMDGLGARMLARKQELMARFEADGLPSPETRTFTGHDLEMSAPIEAPENA